MNRTPSHLWADRSGTTASDPVEVRPDLVVRCHRRRRGPYTGGGELLRRAVPELLAVRPDLVTFRATEIDAMAPDLGPLIPRPPQTLTNTASPEERTRFYAVGRTQRLAHGATELLTDWARLCHPHGTLIEIAELDGADPTDQELVATMLRRCDPAVLTLLVTTGSFDPGLTRALVAHARRVTVPERPMPKRLEPADTIARDLAQSYIDADGLQCSASAERAYLDLSPTERSRRHTARADQLAGLGDPALARGAICYHRELGLEPSTVGAKTLHDAVDSCFELGYYEAAMDFAERGRRLVSEPEDPKLWCAFTHKIGACLSYLGRGGEALPYLAALRRASINPIVQMSCCYMTAMLFTRLLPKEQHDEDLALQCVNTAIAFADTSNEPKDRVFFGAFMRNARALVDLHRGDVEGALGQVNRAIEITDAALAPDEHRLHRSVLRYNRAQVLSSMGDHQGSLADYDEAIRRDPDYGDYYFDRAAVHRSAGNVEQALADYATAIQLTPPFYEAHYNRADLLRDLGAYEEALADLDYALELEPTHVESLLSRADMSLEAGHIERARVDIESGLEIAPEHAHLRSAYALLLAETGDVAGALVEYAAALAADPGLVAALANRAVLLYGEGRLVEAVADLDRALAVDDQPELRLNRAIALQDLDEHARALADLDAVLAADSPEAAEATRRRDASLFALGETDGAAAGRRGSLTFAGSASPQRAGVAGEARLAPAGRG